MDKFDRIYRLHRILAGKRTRIPFEDLRERLRALPAVRREPQRYGTKA